MTEVWKDIPGYEGLYLISNLGNVRSLFTGDLKSAVNVGHGYKAVTLSKLGTKKLRYVHRLVAESFLDYDSDNNQEVNHKNCDKSDNSAENLEWVTHKENMKHAHLNGKIDFRRAKRRDNKSGYAGIFERWGGYFVSIGVNGKRKHIGFFKTIEEAVSARKDAEGGVVHNETNLES